MTLNIKIPSKVTLQKYGLTTEEFESIWLRQDSKCPICLKVPTTGRTNIDHEHVKGFKKLPFELRAQYVRGITCWFCNKNYLARGITVAKAQNVVEYLNAYAAKSP